MSNNMYTTNSKGEAAVRVSSNVTGDKTSIYGTDKDGKGALRIVTSDSQSDSSNPSSSGVTEDWVKQNFMNSGEALYSTKTLSELFQSSNGKILKIYNEEKMPTKGAYTVMSLGWTYADSQNAPALIACELATHKLYFYHGSYNSCNPAAWKEFAFDVGEVSTPTTGTNYGIRGDYCSTYGVVESPNGRPKLGTGNNVIIPAGIRINMVGDTQTTIASQVTVPVTLNKTCFLVFVPDLDDPYQFCEQICFIDKKPEESDATCRVWFDGEKWWYRSINLGDTWVPVVRAQPLAKCIFTGSNLTRLDYIGWYHDSYKNPVSE